MADLAKQFTKEEIINAINHIDNNNIDLIGSTIHLLEYNGKFYPPKEVVRWAARLKELENWEKYRLSGGDNTNTPLKKLGFEIIKKEDLKIISQSLNIQLINKYKTLIKEKGNENELYKFYLINEFKNKWDLDAKDFAKMFLSIDFKNLIYHSIALTSLRKIASQAPEMLRNCFRELFNEEVGLNERISKFCNSLNDLYKSWNPKLQGGIDERTVATLLTLNDPSRYSYYKWTFYYEWCKQLGVKSAKTGECYSDYLEKIDDLITNYIVEDKELLSLHSDYLNKVPFKDEYYNILAQDIIYQVLEKLPRQNANKDYKKEFQQWLNAKTKETSNKVSSYMQALNILSEILNENIFKVSDIGYLNELYDDLVLEQRNENGKYYYAKSPSYGSNGYYSASIKEYISFHQELLENVMSTLQTSTVPLNQILYGPPGTGKTYHTINKAIAIANPDFNINQDRSIVKSEYQRLVENGQIVFTTFHQSMSYEDFVEGIKPFVVEDDEGNKQVIYEVCDGIIKEIVNNAKDIKEVDKNEKHNSFDDAWNQLIELVNEALSVGNEYRLNILTPNLRMVIKDITSNGNLKLKPSKGGDKEYLVSYSRAKKLQESFPDLSVVKNIDKEFRSAIGGMNSTAYWSVLNFINTKIAENNPQKPLINNDSKKNFVLIIDEINRGNVSAIFGELITLIEDNKRLGNKESLEVLLPYSKEKFSVPSNLYIIGTMNTADRSVEALDTALRRRFVFEEMLPQPNILNQQLFGYNASDILEKINKRIEKLIDRDHCIGHAYFLHKNEETIIESFYKNIIPLLQEYFFGDYGKIGLVLGKGFVDLKPKEDSVFAEFIYDYVDELESKPIYEIIDYRVHPKEGLTFADAIQVLMK